MPAEYMGCKIGKMRGAIQHRHGAGSRQVPCSLLGSRTPSAFARIRSSSLAFLIVMRCMLLVSARFTSLSVSEESDPHRAWQLTTQYESLPKEARSGNSKQTHSHGGMCEREMFSWMQASRYGRNSKLPRSLLQVNSQVLSSQFNQTNIDTTYLVGSRPVSEVTSASHLHSEHPWQQPHQEQVGDGSFTLAELLPAFHPPLLQLPSNSTKAGLSHVWTMPSGNITPLVSSGVVDKVGSSQPQSIANNTRNLALAAILLDSSRSFLKNSVVYTFMTLIMMMACCLFLCALSAEGDCFEFKPTSSAQRSLNAQLRGHPRAGQAAKFLNPVRDQHAAGLPAVGEIASSTPPASPAVVQVPRSSAPIFTRQYSGEGTFSPPSVDESVTPSLRQSLSPIPKDTAPPSRMNPLSGAATPHHEVIPAVSPPPPSINSRTLRGERSPLCPGLVVPAGNECYVAVPANTSSTSTDLAIRELTGNPVLYVELTPPNWSPSWSSMLMDTHVNAHASPKPLLMLRIMPDHTIPIASCKAGPESRGGRSTYIYDASDELFGHLAKWIPTESNQARRPCYVLTSGRLGMQWFLEGNFQEHAVHVTNDHGQLLAITEPSMMPFDPDGSYYKLRVTEGQDVGLILCALLAADIMDAR